MLEYPSIDTVGKTAIEKSTLCHAFVKYDGSNLRFEWSKAKGFHKFGTRAGRFDAGDSAYGPAIELFQDLHGPQLLRSIKAMDSKLLPNAGRMVAFAEWFGPGSFAGSHREGDAMALKLFDASVGLAGFVDPKGWTELSDGNPLFAQCLGPMRYGSELAAAIWEGRWDGPPLDHGQEAWEGLVLKARGRHGPLRIKLKTRAWMDALKGSRADWATLV